MKCLLSTVLLGTTLMACGGDDAGDNPGSSSCIDDATLTTLSEHAEMLRMSAALLAGHPQAREATGFFRFPGLEVGRTAVFAGPLIMKCAEAMSYDEFCEDDGLCSRIECTGEGAGWEMHFWLPAPIEGEVAYASASVDTVWADGDTGITFTAASQVADGEDRDWSMSASGRMDVDWFEIEEIYPGLVTDDATVLTIMDTSEGVHGGTLTVGGIPIATPDAATGVYARTVSCL